MTAANLKRLRVFCPEHSKVFQTESQPQIWCRVSNHTLAWNFPQSEAWEYCCDCEVYFPGNLKEGKPARKICPVCSRQIVRWYLCHNCSTLSLESDDPPDGKETPNIISEGVVPSCPACGISSGVGSPTSHICKKAETVLLTKREVCLFCNKNLSQLVAHQNTSVEESKQTKAPDIRTLATAQETAKNLSDNENNRASEPLQYVDDYRKKYLDKAGYVTHDASKDILVKKINSTNEFLIIRENTLPSDIYYVIPSVDNLVSEDIFHRFYHKYFICNRPIPGKILIKKPAVVEHIGILEWRLKAKGDLVIEESKNNIANGIGKPTQTSETGGQNQINQQVATTTPAFNKYIAVIAVVVIFSLLWLAITSASKKALTFNANTYNSSNITPANQNNSYMINSNSFSNTSRASTVNTNSNSSGNTNSNSSYNRFAQTVNTDCYLYNDTNLTTVNIRDGCDIYDCDNDPSTKIGEFPDDTAIKVPLNTLRVTSISKDFSWVKIEIIKTGQIGWVASTKIKCR